MIKLIDGWELDSDGMSYIVRKNSGKTYIDKQGKEIVVYSKTKYPRDIASGLRMVKNEVLKDDIANSDMNMDQLIKRIEELNDEFERLLDEKEI